MKKLTILLTAVLFTAISTMAQVAINTDGTNPNASAMLDIKATDAGLLPPRMTTAERNAISSPADGLIIFNTTSKCLEFYAAGYWIETSGIANAPTVTNSTTGETWMDRNLGASQVATSSTDSDAYGDIYQWGRATEGHESRTSSTTSTNATTAVPNAGNSWDGLFITEGSSPYDWLTQQDNTLWQGVSGTNNPCPSGFRIPTDDEWDAERVSWATNDAAGAFGSVLKLTVGGYRDRSDGSLGTVGSYGYGWSSTVSDDNARHLSFGGSSAGMHGGSRASGFSVRCIKD